MHEEEESNLDDNEVNESSLSESVISNNPNLNSNFRLSAALAKEAYYDISTSFEKQQQHKEQEELITFECIICFNQYDKDSHLPIIICYNQHNLCQECVNKKMFKKDIKEDVEHGEKTETYYCPLCNEQITEDRFRQNNLLIEMYEWINNVSKREAKNIQLIENDRKRLKEEKLEILNHVVILQNKNEEVISTLEALKEENEFLRCEKLNGLLKGFVEKEKELEREEKREKTNIKLENEEEESEEYCEKQEQIMKENSESSIEANSEIKEITSLEEQEQVLIESYEKILSQLKQRQINRKLANQEREKQKNNPRYLFNVNLSHPDIGLFKVKMNNQTFKMQGAFYRKFFQDYNFYYNIVSENPMMVSKVEQQELKFKVKIIKSAKGRIFVGLACKSELNKRNIHNYSGFIGLFAENGMLKLKEKKVKEQIKGEIEIPVEGAYGKPIKQNSIVEVSLNSRSLVFKVDEKISVVVTGETFEELFIKVFKGEAYPIICMQMVEDKVQLVS